MKIVGLVQARMGSTRLPGKVLRTIVDKPLIELLLERLSKSDQLDEIVVATSEKVENDKLQSLVESLGYRCTRGSDKNVLNRFYESAKVVGADVIVRITADCPLIDAALVDECIRGFKKSKVDYFSNTDPRTFPDGLDISVMTFKSIERANNETKSNFDKEHVTSYIRRSKSFTKSSLTYKEDLSNLRWTVDEPEDLILVDTIFKNFYPNKNFNWLQILELQKQKPYLFLVNKKIKNNEGAFLNTGQKLYKRAKRIIPGGNMLLSKRPEMFLPGKWPAYFSKAKGCRVWDLDDNELVDMSIMGIGTNSLGYGHPEVDEEVKRTVNNGNMSTLNCPEEVYLAEKLIDMHPWADMARFARSGGEANAIAIRIARAASGRDKVAICGYHGWHDWYLSANLSDDKGLDGHLLPGLQPKGVPRNLKNTVFPFNYNQIDELESLVKKHDIGVIKMEVARSVGPENNFLQNVRQLATDKGIVLVFDECTTGFRETFGGLHKKYNVEPDMAMFGKALGNGYAITAIIGRQEVMDAAQTTFISSTFWTERIGPTAALKTLEVMQREKSWEKITKIGNQISTIWKKLSNKYKLPITIYGLPALIKMRFESESNLEYKTLITQEMLKRGYLASNSVYVCTEHNEDVLQGYEEALDQVFNLIAECEQGRSINEFLEGEVCNKDFRRLS
ncbi:aminotransferase class III-fold pyridoxal phosphate-dependent enzyme [Candidatus Pelagibacter sp. FZCC0015]|uniref:aminotransferase class III-fold pyridoxal phosphate-dependent enzyme n=1 Tax=Candidatus Pelagibacter sp. FZCC0015 TaxID=2268451 RepID=UPI00119D6735|nr:aminotransferase class III-fold pyridoxal phosphate-dependent enzyme [Candidatus Pelagibacter sp. FZCC0015]